MAKLISICSVPDCERPFLAKHLCSAHYARLRKHGSAGGAKIRAAPGERYRYYLDIVCDYDGDDCLIWPHSRSHYGYATMKLPDGTSVYVCRYLCEDVNGPHPNDGKRYDSAHSCGNGNIGCVAKRHLSWKTHHDNLKDTIAHGRTTRGEKAKNGKLTERDVREIRELTGHLSQRQTAELYGVSGPVICNIRKRNTWAWLED